MAELWIGIDTGGTFTDIALADARTGERWLHKVPTTPDDPARGILEGIEAGLALAGRAAADVAAVSHGTTLATNAVLEGKWAKTGTITTLGFRDILDLARQRRPSFFNLDIEKPTPPSLRGQRIEVRERIAHDGQTIDALDEAAVTDAAIALRDMGCSAVSICFLHSYANPAHERRAAALVRGVWPEAYLCASSDILAEFREFERFSTATVNASLMPLLDDYIARFETGLSAIGVTVEPRVMQSNGGAVSPAAIRRAPVNTFFSRPAGGVIGAATLSKAALTPDIITFDMGGTSTDVCLIADGAPGQANVRDMGGFPVRARTLDLHTIGAGGGSLAWVDPGGLLKVGPKSAGAMPGPACYGRGGKSPTVTDANMALGRLNQRSLLDGRMAVFPERARDAIEQTLCQPLGLDLTAAAAGILDIVNVNMMGAVRVISVERGDDPRRFALMPFGGAGPLHAADVAAMLGMPRVIVPARPGVLSALGLLQADARGDFSVTHLAPALPEAIPDLNAALAALDERAADWLAAERRDAAEAASERLIEMRYLGQNYDLPIPLAGERADAAALAQAVAAFHASHERLYGHAMPERPVEIVNIRLTVVIARKPPPDRLTDAGGDLAAARIETRPVWFKGGFRETPIFARDALPVETPFSGPAVIEQMDATTVIPPDATIVRDRIGNLRIDLPVQAESEAAQ